jgi:putative transcriptional regulator
LNRNQSTLKLGDFPEAVQDLFAALFPLNVTTGVVSKWERGEKQPSGPAAKLLSLAAKNGGASIA